MPIAYNGTDGAIYIPDHCLERYLPLQSAEGGPLRDAGITLSGISYLTPGYFLERTAPDYHVLVYTLSGEGRLSTGGRALSLPPGTLLVAPAHVHYRYEVADREWNVLWFHTADREPWLCLRSGACRVVATLLMNDILTAAKGFLASIIPSHLASSRLAYLFAEQIIVYLEMELSQEDSQHERRIRRQLYDLWNHVNSHLGQPWTVGELASRICIAPSHFHRLVLRYNGCTPQAMVLRLRMQRAEELLLHYGAALKVIAEELAYSSPYAFSRAFKRYKGVSPEAYRNGDRSP